MKYIFNAPTFNQKMCELFNVEDSGDYDDFKLPDDTKILEPWNKGLKTGSISNEHKQKISKSVRKTLLKSWENPDFRKQRCEAMKLAWKDEQRIKNRKKQNCKYVYEITTPSGEKVITENMNEYCRMNGLSEENLRKVIRGKRKHHKNYTATILGEIEK